MPRRSLRSSSLATTPVKILTSAATSAASKHGKRTRVTPLKSQHFAKNPTVPQPTTGRLPEGHDESEADVASPDGVDEEVSGYEDEDATASEPSSVEEEDNYDSDISDRPKKRQKRGGVQRPAPAVSTSARPAPHKKGRPGVTTGYGPGTEVITDVPKARPAGAIPYTDDTIHPNTMLFLKDLAENNDRAWLKMQDLNYRASLKDFNSFLECLQEKVIEVDETIPELPLKDIIFRIYRDVRFSSDQTPYKTHFSAAWSRTGRKGPFACYYMQIKPGGSFIGGGLWMPEAAPLAALRINIDSKPHKIRQVLMNPGLRKQFLGGISADESKAVKAFVGQNSDNALKTKPKGYDADHRDIALLRLRNFTLGRKLQDKEILGKGGLSRIKELFECLLPLITYLNSVVMPDGSDSEDENDR